MLKKLLFVLIMVLSTISIAQTKITGVVYDNEYNQPLPGANVQVKGTTDGAVTDFDGKFEIITSQTSGEVVVSYLGYITKTIVFNGSTNIGSINIEADANQLKGLVMVGKGVVDLAADRKTPIAVSTIKAAEIQAKVGTADVTQALVNTPSVYVAGQAGGYGDSRITVRGFEQDNTAFLLNGQPINGMEDGLMYWSNWSGMADIANVIQIQRGLGSSKLAISSVGGTVNFVTKATDKKKGGFASMGVANDDYFKSTVGYNTGMSEKGFGFSVMMTHWQGDGYNRGTKGEGQNYFISFGYKPNEKHNFNFLLTGAPQYHDQNFTKSISSYLEFGRKYNSNWGYLNGQYFSERRNYYHKPVANLNWDYSISDKTSLSTVLYASLGRGGGTGNLGSSGARVNGLINWDNVVAVNEASPTGASSYALRSSVNNHIWYGMVSNLSTQLNENISLNAGLDLRNYKGTHFRQIIDLLGADYYLDTNNINIPNNQISATYCADPWAALFNFAEEGERYAWDYDERITYGGLFGQIEYSKNNFSTFFQGAISNQSHVRWDRYQYLPEDEESEKVNNVGYNVKAGAAYKINDKHTIFTNAGYYSRQPYHDNIYLNFGNDVNPLTENEKILGFELGYSFNSQYFSANLNAYRTSWKDRVTTTSDEENNQIIYTTNQGLTQLHSGVEIDFVTKPIKSLELKGFASFGDWKYEDDAQVVVRDEDRNIISEETVEAKNGKVGGAAQTTYGLGFNYKIVKGLSFDTDWRNYDKLYSDDSNLKESIELPSYDLVDAGISYRMHVGKEKKNSVNIRLNVNNVFDEVYLSELTSADKVEAGDEAWKGINVSNRGFFGLGRTWNFTVRYNF